MSKQEIRAHLFGVMSLSHNSQELPLPNSSVARRLLAYLLLKKDRSHNRSVVAGTFWAESTEARARKSLSQTLWHIRQSFPDLINASLEEIVIAHPDLIWTDAQEFENTINAHLVGEQEISTSNSLSAALNLYRGELLEGIYDDWALLERERYGELYLQGLEKLAGLEKMGGNYLRSLEITQQLLQRRPYDESFHQEAMRLYHLLDKADAAIRQYETCCQVLRNQFDVEPEAKTVLLAQEIARQATLPTSIYLPKQLKSQKPIDLDKKRATSLALVGREKERGELLHHLEAAFQNQGGIVFIEGEAGVGKTRLLREIVKDAEWRNAQVLWGDCPEQEVAQPFGPFVTALNQGLSPLRVRQLGTVVDPLWSQVLKPLLPQIAQTLPELDAPPLLRPEQEHARVIEGIINFLIGWATIAPLLLVIEDLHWADEDTLSLLSVLQNRLREQRILLVGTFRGDDARAIPTVWERLQALDRAGLRGRQVLAQLNSLATGQLIRRCLGLSNPAPVFEKRIFKETEGNPLFVLEVLRTLQDEGLLTQDEDGTWRTPWDDETVDYGELPLPPLVEEVIDRRLKHLSPRSQQLLSSGAVLGQQFDFSVLTAMCELDIAEIFEPIQDLVNRQLWEETEEGYQFSHAKVRQVSLNTLDSRELAERHRRALMAIEDQFPEKADILAFHAEQAGSWKKAGRYAYNAGKLAMQSHAYSFARMYFEKALSFLEQVDEELVDRFVLFAEYEKTLDLLGDRDTQEEILTQMQNLVDDDSEKSYWVNLRWAWRLAYMSDFDGAQNAAKQALAAAEELDDLARQADALDVLGTALTWQGNNEEAVVYLERAVSAAEKLRTAQIEGHYRSSLGSALLGAKKYDDAKREILRSLPLMESNPRELADTYNLLGILYMEQGAADDAVAAYERSLENSKKIGFLYGYGRALVNLGNLNYFQGRFGTTLALYDQAIPIFAQIEQKRGEVQLRLNRASMWQTYFGDSAQVVADAEYSLAYAEETGDRIGAGQSLTVLAESCRQSGDLWKARQYLEQGEEEIEKAGDQWLLVQIYGAQALLAIDDNRFDDALERTATAIGICDKLGLPDMLPRLLMTRGSAYYHMGAYDKALSTLTESIERMTSGAEHPFMSHYWHAKVLLALGQEQEAEDAISKAYELLMETLENLSPQHQKLSLEKVAEHRAIVEEWERQQSHRITVTVPKVEGGSVDILWTVEAKEDAKISKKVARRRHQLRRLLKEARKQGGAPTYQHLADALNVGLRTIERDMAVLAEE